MVPLKLGTRASPLSLAQTDQVIAALAKVGLQAKAQTFSTSGDRDLRKPLYTLGDKRLFTQELEAALTSGAIDAAVHSAKDLSAIDEPELPLVAALARDSRADLLISSAAGGLHGLPQGARVGTSSLRRAAQLHAVRPDAQVVAVRGNVQTRIKKWQAGQVDALILAAAGLRRLDMMADLPTYDLDWDTAPGQGVIAIQAKPSAALWGPINHGPSFQALALERASVRGLGAHCRLPVSCHLADDLTLRLSVWDSQGSARTLTGRIDQGVGISVQIQQAEALGRQLKQQLSPAYGS